MTTVFDVSLSVARKVMDVLYGVSTAGDATSLTDSQYLVQKDQFWDRGTLWIRSGDHSGKVLTVTGFTAKKLKFATLAPAPSSGVRYAVAREAYPWLQIVDAIEQALEETHVEGDDESLVGDGETLDFVLPSGVFDIKRVEFERAGRVDRIRSNHWKITGGELRFDYGFSPYDGDVIHVIHRDEHPALTSYSTEISNEINPKWLMWKAMEKLLLWGASQYQKDPEYLIEEKMNIALANLKGQMPRLDGPDIEMHTSGGGMRAYGA